MDIPLNTLTPTFDLQLGLVTSDVERIEFALGILGDANIHIFDHGEEIGFHGSLKYKPVVPLMLARSKAVVRCLINHGATVTQDVLQAFLVMDGEKESMSEELIENIIQMLCKHWKHPKMSPDILEEVRKDINADPYQNQRIQLFLGCLNTDVKDSAVLHGAEDPVN